MSPGSEAAIVAERTDLFLNEITDRGFIQHIAGEMDLEKFFHGNSGQTDG